MRLYVTDDGRAGFAIRDGDELVSVFAYPRMAAGDAIVEKAVREGAMRLDCYATPVLDRLYRRHGFHPVARIPWDDRYAPDGWDRSWNGTPDVQVMAITDRPPLTPPETDYDTGVRQGLLHAARTRARRGRDA